MKQRPRIYYTESQKKLMWDHWQKGDSLQQIAQLFDRNHSLIQRPRDSLARPFPSQGLRPGASWGLGESYRTSFVLTLGVSAHSELDVVVPDVVELPFREPVVLGKHLVNIVKN